MMTAYGTSGKGSPRARARGKMEGKMRGLQDSDEARAQEVREEKSRLEERIAGQEAELREGGTELSALRKQLAAANDAKAGMEQELRDAMEAVRNAGGSASEMMEAKREIARLKKASKKRNENFEELQGS